jgi:O-antigen ligase
MKNLNFFKGKSIWVSLLPVFIALYLLFSMVSISFGQIFISLALICWVIILVRKEEKFAFPSFFWPILVYVGLSLVSSFLSVNMKLSLKDSRELLLFLLIPIVYTGFREEDTLKKANLALLASAYVSSLYSLYQFTFKFKANFAVRIQGFMGQVMTQGGLLMLFSCMALSILIFSHDRIRYLWGLGLLLALFAVTLSQTRNAWIGLIIAASVILFIYKPKALILVPLAVALFYLASPQLIKKRALSSFNLKDLPSMVRIEYLRVGLKIISEYPLFGTGPDTVKMVYQDPKYGLSEDAKKFVHLHNNILQTAAERGIPTLLAWLTLMVWVFLSLLRLLKNKDPALLPLTAAGLGALVALFTAGLFEYNFADSEVTTLFLYMITIPFSLARIQKKETGVQNCKRKGIKLRTGI